MGSWPRDQDTARAEGFKLNRRYRHELPRSTGWRQRVQGRAAGRTTLQLTHFYFFRKLWS